MVSEALEGSWNYGYLTKTKISSADFFCLVEGRLNEVNTERHGETSTCYRLFGMFIIVNVSYLTLFYTRLSCY